MNSTSDFMLCDILDCGYDDIKYLFDGMDRNILSDSIVYCKDIDDIECGTIWTNAIMLAIAKVFGYFDYDEFEIRFNYIDSDIYFLGNKDNFNDYDKLCDKFEKLTGFEIIYYED